MATAPECSVTLRPEVMDRVDVLAAQRGCSAAELISESVQWYEDMARLFAAVESGGNPSELIDNLTMGYANRVIHEYRAERRAESQGQLKAS
jgi:hypothetical protein